MDLPTFLAWRTTSSCLAVIVEGAKLALNSSWQKEIIEIREWCKEKGTLFIIDEIITGFRVPKWTVSNLWSLDPDIILLGKGIANGYPLAVVAGKKEIMDASEYFVSSTFSGEAVSLAACQATIAEIHQKNLVDLMFYGKRLQDKLNALHPEIKFEGYGTRAMLNMTNPTTALFAQEMCKAGFLFGKAHFFNFAHLEANIEDLVMSAAKGVVDQINQGNVKLEGDVPRETFKR
jgi:glutamate-1-semialdehyde aminotransferase